MHSTPRILFDSTERLSHAIAAADTYAMSHFPHSLIVRNALWRYGAASEQQIKFVNKFVPTENKYDEPGEHVRGRKLTKGAAGEFITRVRHGGKAMWAKSRKENLKLEKDLERINRVREAENVYVGTLSA
jgi:ATP-dependent helicase IRC3